MRLNRLSQSHNASAPSKYLYTHRGEGAFEEVGDILAEDDYELLPHKDIEQLRAEIDRLKKNPLGEGVTQTSLLDAITGLNANLVKLSSILQGANDEMLKAYHDTTVQEELRRVRAENAKIAHGIVALAEFIKEVQGQVNHALPRIDDFLAAQEKASAIARANQTLQPDFHADALAADLTRAPNPFSDPNSPDARRVPDMDVPPPPPAFR